jgi:hypothetical protein
MELPEETKTVLLKKTAPLAELGRAVEAGGRGSAAEPAVTTRVLTAPARLMSRTEESQEAKSSPLRKVRLLKPEAPLETLLP